MINIVDLPPELLVQVFSHYGAHGRSRGQPKASLDTLRRVSCLWNTLVVASPILWTDIMVPEKAVHPCAIMSLSVKRSKDMPFSITVDAAGPLVDSAMPMINILCILNAQRLKALSLSVNGSTQASSLIRSLLTVEHFPVLQQISIVQPSQGPLLANPFFDPGIPLFKGAAPVLRTMMLSNMDKIPFPLQNISQLELRQCQPATLDVLRECPRLTRLGLFALTPLTGPSVTSNPIILSSLTSLSVEPPRRRNNIDLSNLHYLIQRLSFPALEDLELIGLRSPVPWSALFPWNPIFPSLHTLKLVQFARIQMTTGFHLTDPDFLTRHPIKHLVLDDVAVETLFATLGHGVLPPESNAVPPAGRIVQQTEVRGTNGQEEKGSLRRVSTPGRNSVDHGQPKFSWPELNTVTLHFLAADQLAWLLNMLPSRPLVTRLNLSAPTRAHLTRSLAVDGQSFVAVPWWSKMPVVDCEKLVRKRGIEVQTVVFEKGYRLES